MILIMGLMTVTHLPCHSELATLSSEGVSPRTAAPGRHCDGGGCQPEEEHIIMMLVCAHYEDGCYQGSEK